MLVVLEAGGRLRWALQAAAGLWRLPPQLPAERGCSRAVHKLQEALGAVRAGAADGAPPRLGTVIDLGAWRSALSHCLGLMWNPAM